MQEQTITTLGNYQFNPKYCIGQGSFGKVYKGKHMHEKKLVAIKQLDRTMVSESQMNKQLEILKSLAHPNIVQYQDAFQTLEFYYIVTEYCNGGDISGIFGGSQSQSQGEEQGQRGGNGEVDRVAKLADMFFQVCEGFVYLHKFNIIHRDLKPTNILIHNGVYKIADFGVARTEQLHKSFINNELIGVPIYMSPQILSKNFYSYKCDIWSIGVIIYEFFFQKLPWKASDVNNLFFQIMANPTPYLDHDVKVPSLLLSIFQKTLKYLEKERMSWEELLSLQKTRKKIFSDNKTKSLGPIQQTINDIPTQKINKTIPPFEAELVHHILSQCKSLNSEIVSLVGEQCKNTFIATASNYLLQGQSRRTPAPTQSTLWIAASSC